MALLAVAVAGAALGSFLLQQTKNTQSRALEQHQAMRWAHQAVQTFLTVQGRLPCPAATRGGTEVCAGGGGKGWLPVASLMSTAGTRLPPVHGSMAMRYVVNRGGAAGAVADLTALGALYQPVFSPGERPAAYPPGIESTMDACTRLESAAAAGGMAYGIAVGAPGAPDSASGINADFQLASLESPTRTVDHVYQDIVSLRSPAEVLESTRCEDTSASLDALAVASTWVDAATDVQQANIERGDTNAQITTLSVVSDGFYLVDAMADLANGAYNLTNNAAMKAIASANPALWGFVPVHTGGMAKALSGVALSAIDAARNAGTLAIRAGQLHAFKKMSSSAIEQPVWQGAAGMLVAAQQAGMAARLPVPISWPSVEP